MGKKTVGRLLLCYQDNLSPHSIQGLTLVLLAMDNSFLKLHLVPVDGNNDGKRKPYDWDDVMRV